MSQPLVSIIILSYNYAHYIGQAIQSVLDQTYANWELVIIDDGSRDNSLEVIRSFTDPRITVIELETNRGACRAYNRAYEHCQGKYLGSLDADDYFLPDKLAVQVAYMEAHPEIDITGTFIYQVGEAGQTEEGRHSLLVNRERDLNLIDNWAMADYLCHSSALLRKASHDRLGGLTPDLDYMPDYELWLRGRVSEMRFKVLPQPLTCYRAHSGNVTNNLDRRQFMLQFAFLYCALLGPYLTHHNRPDLVEHCASYLLNEFFPQAPFHLKTHFLQKLADFPLYPPEPQPFFEVFTRHLDPQLWQYFVEQKPAPALYGQAAAPAPRPKRNAGLIIIDDYFPNVITSFRVHEFNYYLQRLNCQVYSTNPDFEKYWQEYAGYYPQYKDRVKPLETGQPLDGSLLYTVFLGNAYALLPLIESQELPFCFTLYPGGAFQLNDPASDYKLLKVLHSPFFKKVIVTRQTSRDYLIYNGFCPKEKIEFIHGAVFPNDYYKENLVPHRRFGKEKSTLDICFVALKHMPLGIDKGYDTFIKVAHKLAALSPFFRFHVVGDFDRDEIDVTALGDTISFYGRQPTAFFPAFHAGMDLILSPNLPYKLGPGAFDGFPTGSCSEAGINGVAVFCTDELKDNFQFEDGQEIVIINTDPDDIVRKIMYYYNEPQKLAQLAASGQARFQEINNLENKMRPRLRVLAEYI